MMDAFDLASRLFGNSRAESRGDVSNSLDILTATGAGDSSDGAATVYLDADVTPADDYDGDDYAIGIPTSPNVIEGDGVLVGLTGSGPLKTPVVISNPGSGDRMQVQVDNAETLAHQVEAIAQEAAAEVEQVRQDVADFRDDVATTYATKVERQDGDDAVKTWVTTNYTNSNDLATTYATKTLVSQTKDAIELAASQTYETQSDAAATYATKSALTVGLDGIRTEVAEDYQPKGDYATTASMNSAIQQSASSIESSVAATYETQSDAAATYATKTEVQQTASGLDTRITTAQSTADGAYLERSATGTTIDTTGAATIRSLTIHGQSVQDGTPTPSAPVEIQNVELENLLDESTFNTGVYSINSDGSLHVSGADGRAWASWTPNTVELNSANTSYYWTSDVPIYVQIGTTSVRSSINGATSGFVNSNGASKLMVKVLAPTGKTYPFDVRFSLTAYPVRYPLSFDSVIQHVAVGINALPSGTDFTQPNSAGGVTVTRTGGVYTFSGTPQSTGGRLDNIYLINAFRVPAGTYRATAFYSGSGALTMHVQKNNGNNTYTILQSTGTFSSSGTYPTNAFEVSDGDCLFIGFNIATSGVAYNSTAKVMLTRGTDVPTEYEPYQGTTTPIDLQGHALRSLPDGTHDEMAVDSLGRVTMTQRVGVTTTATTDGITATVGVDAMSTTGDLSDGATVLYPLATPQTIDLGTIDLPTPADTLWLDAALVSTIGATWWTVGGIAGQQALDAEVTERQTLIRQFSGGVLAGYVGNAIAALVNAAGSFDVVQTAWSGGVPSILGTLARYAASGISLFDAAGNVLAEFASDHVRIGGAIPEDGSAEAAVRFFDSNADKGAMLTGYVDQSGDATQQTQDTRTQLRTRTHDADMPTTYGAAGESGLEVGQWLHAETGSYSTVESTATLTATADSGTDPTQTAHASASLGVKAVTVDDSAEEAYLTVNGVDVPMEQAIAALTTPLYSATVNASVSGTGIDAYTTGASVSLPAGTYLVIGAWEFNTATTSGTRNNAVALFRGSTYETQTRVFSAAQNYAALQVVAVMDITTQTTVSVRGASTRPSGAAPTRIYAIRIR